MTEVLRDGWGDPLPEGEGWVLKHGIWRGQRQWAERPKPGCPGIVERVRLWSDEDDEDDCEWRPIPPDRLRLRNEKADPNADWLAAWPKDTP